MISPPQTNAEQKTSSPKSWWSTAGALLQAAIWFGIVTGVVEGTSLLFFQSINSERWGLMVHVSEPIIWISIVVDVLFFSVLALPIALAARHIHRETALTMAAFLFTLSLIYDWLTLTERLGARSCVLLAIGIAVAFGRWVAVHPNRTLNLYRRSLPSLVAIAVLAFSGIEGGRWLAERRAVSRLPLAASDSPNVLIIVVDTLRADHLASYGYSRVTSPNLDSMAREGILFENAISPSSWTLPSHASLLTGRYPFDHGVDKVVPRPLSWDGPKLGNYPTLGEAMQRLGYRTGAFSANRIYFSANLGFTQGFMHFEDYFHSVSDMFVRTLIGREFVRHFMYRKWRSNPNRLLRRIGVTSFMDRDEEGAAGYLGPFSLRKRAGVVNQEVLNWIDRDSTRPFFAFLNYFDVHNPYGHPDFDVHSPTGGPNAESVGDLQSRIDRYDDGIQYADDYLGRLLHQLKKRGLDRKTFIVITSDHGESLWQHRLATHGKALYRELLHVPLVFWYSDHLPAGWRVPTMVTTASIPATILELVGVDAGQTFPAQTLVPLWKGPRGGFNEQPVLAELSTEEFPDKILDRDAHKFVMTSFDGPIKSLLTSDWHLILHKNLGDQLYSWRDDRDESKNLINTRAGRIAEQGLIPELQNLLTGLATGISRPQVAPMNVVQSNILAVPGKASRMANPKQRLNDYFRIQENGGDRISIQVRAREPKSAIFDPIVSIEDGRGNLLESCRNPGDDGIPPPGVPDPTPGAFDDLCVNHYVDHTTKTTSSLEILIPGSTSSTTELLIRVTDWNAGLGPGRDYQISVDVDRELAGNVK